MNIISPLLQQFKDNRWFKQVGCIEGEFSKTITLNLPTTNLGQQIYFNSDTELDNAIIKLSTSSELVKSFGSESRKDALLRFNEKTNFAKILDLMEI